MRCARSTRRRPGETRRRGPAFPLCQMARLRHDQAKRPRGRQKGKRAMKHITHWIGGKLWDGAADRHGEIYNPATGEVSGTVDFASAAVVGDAVAAAGKALPGWRGTSIAKRTQIMFAFRELIRHHQQELAELISSEHGKVAADAAGEVARGLEVVEFAC